MPFDEFYKANKNAFGSEPERILIDHAHHLEPSLPVLDLGAGQGRNSIYLARRGFDVVAVDPSKAALDGVYRYSCEQNLSIQIQHCDFKGFSPQEKYFSGILLIGLIQILSWDEISDLMECITRWTRQGSLVFTTAFSTDDPAFGTKTKQWIEAGRNSFIIDKTGTVRTYLEKNEILDLFLDWEVFYHWEGMGEKHKHGTGPEECHGMIEAVFRR